MRSQDLSRQLQVLEGLIDKSDDLHDDLELLGHWGRYLCVRAAGFLENALREVLSSHARTRAQPQVARFAQKMLERITNPKAERFISTLQFFDPEWGHALEQYLDEEDGRRKNAIDSLMANRHLIAHGKNTGISVKRVEEYLEQSVQVVRYIEDLCA